MRKAAALLIVLVAAALGGTARSGAASSARSCPAKATRAVIGGKAVCLRAGVKCARSRNAQYRRHGFLCRANGRLARAKKPKPVPPPTTAPAPTTVTLKVTGPEQVVFDWATQRCAALDIPDLPVRAFRDASGDVQLIAASNTGWRFVGPDLDHLSHPCAVTLASDHNPDPAAFDDNEWIAAPYTPDGRTVYALLHEEYHGWEHPGQCSSTVYDPTCWYNAITLAVSTDGGATYHDSSPTRLVATVPYRYVVGGGPDGLRSPSNIVRNPADGYYYTLVYLDRFDTQVGLCLLRTRNLADPGSWRAWSGGTSFDTTFVDPYGSVSSPAGHLCETLPIGNPGDLQPDSLTWSTVAHQWLLVGMSTGGAYDTLSPDLIHWSTPQLFYPRQVSWNYTCGDPDPMEYPALIDPSSTSRNFETSGATAYLYFTLFRTASGCTEGLDRDLVRVPVSITAP